MIPVRKVLETCTGCEACFAACPVSAIEMRFDEDGFANAWIDSKRCTSCGKCRALCPVGKSPARPFRGSFAAFAKDTALRAKSSSGGLFSLLAEEVLDTGGLIFGAAMEEDGTVAHRAVTSREGLAILRGSKYVQSSGLTGCYEAARTALGEGRRVLFSGTPCQIAGLYAYLGRGGATPLLLTVDLVCHGVPSPMVYQAYRRSQEQRQGAKITRLDFRDQTRGWKDFGMRVCYAEGPDTVADMRTDPYLAAFLQNLSLRACCTQCAFAGERRQGDLTLADCWGAPQVVPQLDDDRGLSLVLVGSPAGEAALAALAPRMVAQPVDAQALVPYNPCILHPVRPHPRRKAFLAHVRRQGFLSLERFFRPPSLWERGVGKARRLLQRLFQSKKPASS